MWYTLNTHWCEHKPSVTIYYKDEDFLEIAQEIYNNFDSISGISLLPYNDHIYPQAPYTPCSKEEYEKALAAMPKNVDWSELAMYDQGEDNTESSQTLACTGGACEL